MNIYLVKSTHNVAASQVLQSAVNNAALAVVTIEEGFDDQYKSIRATGMQSIPSVVAIHEGVLVHQTDSPSGLASFLADAEAKLAEME